MGRKYRQGRKIFWATLALLLLLVAVPLSVGAIEWWNEKVAGTEVKALEINSDNDTIAQPTNPDRGGIYAYVFDTSGKHGAEQSVFWNANGSWDEMIINTGATGADNTSTTNQLYFNWNITAKDIIDQNVNKIVIKLKGIQKNSSIRIFINAVKNGYSYTGDTNYEYAYSLIGPNVYSNLIFKANGTALNATINIDPARAKIAAANLQANDSRIIIKIESTDPANDFFSEGDTLFFQIYTLHPHGRLTFSSYDWTEIVLAFWSGVGLVVLMVTSPAWNPTTHNGFIEKMIQHRRYSRSSRNRRTRRSGSHRRTHRTNRRGR